MQGRGYCQEDPTTTAPASQGERLSRHIIFFGGLPEERNSEHLGWSGEAVLVRCY